MGCIQASAKFENFHPQFKRVQFVSTGENKGTLFSVRDIIADRQSKFYVYDSDIKLINAACMEPYPDIGTCLVLRVRLDLDINISFSNG